MTLNDALVAALNNDAGFIAIITGGAMNAEKLDEDGYKAFPKLSSGRIHPTCVVRDQGQTRGEIPQTSARRTLEFYFYDQYGYSQIEAGISYLFAHYHRAQIAAEDTAGVAGIEWLMDGPKIPDENMNNRPCQFSRYALLYRRF